MRKTGIMELDLHYGAAPRWLISRMLKLAKGIFTVVVDEFGVEEVLVRLSDPLFFQACSNVLGFDWDSSGATTVTCGVLKNVFNETDLGIRVAGGKGKRSRKTPFEIESIVDVFSISTAKIEQLKYASRMTAKVDNAAIQAGYQLYHHSIFVSERGGWTVVQQGMNIGTNTTRRYHWLSRNVKSFVDEPHTGVVGDMTHKYVLDMTSHQSEECRKVSTDLANEKPERVRRQYLSIRSSNQAPLTTWIRLELEPEHFSHYKFIPEKVNWQALHEAYELKPRNYEELLAVKGVGPATVRGLALVSELIYGAKPSWRDPVKFSFAFGGKDGVPYPVNRKAMDEAIQVLKQATESAKIGNREKLEALKRLKFFSPD